MFALHDLHDAAIGAAIVAAALDARENGVAMHRVANSIAANKKIAIHFRLLLGGHYEAVAVAMRDKAAADQIRIALRLALLILIRGLRFLASSGAGFLLRAGEVPFREAKASAVDFLDHTLALQLVENLGHDAASAVMQAQIVGHFADALRLVELGQVRQKLRLGDFDLVELLIRLHSVRRPFYWCWAIRERIVSGSRIFRKKFIFGATSRRELGCRDKHCVRRRPASPGWVVHDVPQGQRWGEVSSGGFSPFIFCKTSNYRCSNGLGDRRPLWGGLFVPIKDGFLPLV